MRRRTPTCRAGGVMNEGLYASWLGLSGIPREAEAIPLERDLLLARLTRGAYHAAKISTALSAAAVARAKSDGANVTAGVSINNLSLNENDVGEYRTFFRLAPPLRAEEDRLAMIDARASDGTIDVIVSSHDPQDVDTKRLPFADAADGAIGLETLLGAALRLLHNGDVPLLRLVEVLSTAPARLLRPAGRHAGAGRVGRPHPRRPRRALGGQRSRHPLALQEHLFRRRAHAGPGLANAGRRPHSLFGLGWGNSWDESQPSPSAPCRTSPPQGRLIAAVSPIFTVHGGTSMTANLPLRGEMSGRTEGREGSRPPRLKTRPRRMTTTLLALAFGYLLGSIPFGLLLTRAAGLGDVRAIGSGNIGATNVLRTGNKKLAAATLLLDALKGTAAVLDRRHLWPGSRHGRRRRRLPRPHPAGLAGLQGRQGRRHLYRRARSA